MVVGHAATLMLMRFEVFTGGFYSGEPIFGTTCCPNPEDHN